MLFLARAVRSSYYHGKLFVCTPFSVLGLASIIDFGNTLIEYNYANNGEQADYLALRQDWYCVGEDMRIALRASRSEVARSYATQEQESQAIKQQ